MPGPNGYPTAWRATASAAAGSRSGGSSGGASPRATSPVFQALLEGRQPTALEIAMSKGRPAAGVNSANYRRVHREAWLWRPTADQVREARLALRQARRRGASLHPVLRAADTLIELAEINAFAAEDLIDPGGNWEKVLDCGGSPTHYLLTAGYPSNAACVGGQAVSVSGDMAHYASRGPSTGRGLRFLELTHYILVAGGLAPRYRVTEVWGHPASGAQNHARPRPVPGWFRVPQIFPEVHARSHLNHDPQTKTAPERGEQPPAQNVGQRFSFPRRRPDEKKKGLAQRGYMLAGAVYDQADEFRQALDIIWDSLPKSCRGSRRGKSFWDRAQDISRCASKMNSRHLAQMVGRLLVNQIEDRAIGFFHAGVSKGMRAAGGRAAGVWKNPSANAGI